LAQIRAAAQLLADRQHDCQGGQTQTGYASACGSLKRTQFLLVRMQLQPCKPGLGHPILTTGQRNDNPLQKWLVTVLKRILMIKDKTVGDPFMVRSARVWSRASSV